MGHRVRGGTVATMLLNRNCHVMPFIIMLKKKKKSY